MSLRNTEHFKKKTKKTLYTLQASISQTTIFANEVKVATLWHAPCRWDQADSAAPVPTGTPVKAWSRPKYHALQRTPAPARDMCVWEGLWGWEFHSPRMGSLFWLQSLEEREQWASERKGWRSHTWLC